METTCSSETSGEFQQSTRRYIPQDRTLHRPVYVITYQYGDDIIKMYTSSLLELQLVMSQ
jgi:hypothetical protein